MNLLSVKVEAWDDVGRSFSLGSGSGPHVFVRAWFLRLARPRNMNVYFLQCL